MAGIVSPALASETITYTYDALGRLIKVDHGASGPNAGSNATYTYDKSDNRSQVAVVASSGTTLTLTPASLPPATVGAPYSQTIGATGGTAPYTFSGTGLPAWLTLNSQGGLSGTPTAAGTSPSFTISANDSAGKSGSSTYTVTVSSGTTTLTLTPASLPGATVGTAYSQSVGATGGTAPYTFSGTGLPAWLTLNSQGALSGTPTAAGTTPSFTISASDGAGDSGSQSYSISVAPANDLTLAPAALASGTVGSPYSQTIGASGGTAPYTFSKNSGSLPAGLALGSNGILSGTPTTVGSSTFVVKAADSSGNHVGTKSYTVTIGAGATTIQLTSTNHNLRTVANANGYTGSTTANYTFVVASAVTITGAAGADAIDTGTWPSGVTLKLTVNGTVRGGGGNGGAGGGVSGSSLVAATAGGAGGDAIQCSAPISISVPTGGVVQGGGGGGGGGATDGESVGSGPGGYQYVIPGAGGGGGAPNGAGGAGATGYLTTTSTAGAPGTTSGGGASGTNGTGGGPGGSYATAGSAGGAGTEPPGAGGAAGFAVRKGTSGCTATGAGTITGTVG